MFKNDLLEMLRMLDKDLFQAIEGLNQYVKLLNGSGKKITIPLIEKIREVSRRLNNLSLVISDLSLTHNTPIEHININIDSSLCEIMNEPHELYKD